MRRDCTPRKRALRSKWSKSTLKIKSAEKIKQSKRLARNQTIKIPQIPLSHPTGLHNQNNQNPGKIPGNGKHCNARVLAPFGARSAAVGSQYIRKVRTGYQSTMYITTTRYGNEGHTHAPTLRKACAEKRWRESHTHAHTHTLKSDKGHTHTLSYTRTKTGGAGWIGLRGGRHRALTHSAGSLAASVERCLLEAETTPSAMYLPSPPPLLVRCHSSHPTPGDQMIR